MLVTFMRDSNLKNSLANFQRTNKFNKQQRMKMNKNF